MTDDRASLLRSIGRLTARERHVAAAARGGLDRTDDADKVRPLLDAVAVLAAQDAHHALIGGVAVGLHSGLPRATLSVVLSVETARRGPRLVQALVAAGFELRGEHAHSVNLRHASGEPVQLAFDASFDPMIARAESFVIDGVRIRVVTRADLVEMKRRAAADPSRRRSKALRDQADVELLLGDAPEPDEGW